VPLVVAPIAKPGELTLGRFCSGGV